MDISFEQKVREKAYEIWKAAGMTEGMADEHWLNAEKAVMGETGAPAKKAAAKKPAAKPAKAKDAKAKDAKAKSPAKANAKSSTAKH